MKVEMEGFFSQYLSCQVVKTALDKSITVLSNFRHRSKCF